MVAIASAGMEVLRSHFFHFLDWGDAILATCSYTCQQYIRVGSTENGQMLKVMEYINSSFQLFILY